MDSSAPNLSKPSKKKIAIILGYRGTNYQGIQINPNAVTLGSIVFNTLCSLGLVSKENSVDSKKVSMVCASRTDKGVHAIMQVISVKLLLLGPLEDLTDKINGHLPTDVRAFGLVKVTNSFQARFSCESRVYEYLLPTFILQLLDQETIRFLFDSESSWTGLAEESWQTHREYRIDPSSLDRLKDLANVFVGTISFHNYTVAKSIHDPSSKRFIKSIQVASEILSFDNCFQSSLEWIKFTIHGSSFMLHQIRKMMGMIILAMKTGCCVDAIRYTFVAEKVNIPKAPGFGLILAETCFDGYNQKKDRPHPLDSTMFQDERDGFKRNVIYTEIHKIETLEHCFYNWWQGVAKHFYEQEYLKPFLSLPPTNHQMKQV